MESAGEWGLCVCVCVEEVSKNIIFFCSELWIRNSKNMSFWKRQVAYLSFISNFFDIKHLKNSKRVCRGTWAWFPDYSRTFGLHIVRVRYFKGIRRVIKFLCFLKQKSYLHIICIKIYTDKETLKCDSSAITAKLKSKKHKQLTMP